MADTSTAAGAGTGSAEQYWEAFYQERDSVWSGRPNRLLVREVAALPPGSALDLGCGEGADAVWLAEQGWQVTAVDISATALRRAAGRAADAGLAGRIDWQRHDLARSFPAGRFDLVSAQYLHSPVAPADERASILRRAAEAVAPGGILLVVGHASGPSWHAGPPVRFPTNAEVLAALALAPEQWQIETDEVVTSALTAPDGRPGTRADSILKLRRTHPTASAGSRTRS
mgnify:CR=1 FL=1